jgi:prephenate dehydrogenase
LIGGVSIVGAGQVGTMLGMALRSAPPDAGVTKVTLFDRDRAVAEESLALGGGDLIADRIDEALEAEAVILAVPVTQIVKLLDELGSRVPPEVLLMDTGSAKVLVVEAMRRNVPPTVHAIGGHPLVGTERPGPSAAQAELLRGAVFALTPVSEDAEPIERARDLVQAMGARPLVLTAQRHDQTVALTSHVPHLLAFALASVVAAAEQEEGFEPALESSGLAGAVRLAASDPAMVAGFLSANASLVRTALRRLRGEIDRIDSVLDADPSTLEATLVAGPGTTP